MAWTIVLENENKKAEKILSKELCLSEKDVAGTILLKYLDPYGDLTLNHIQMVDLIKDLSSIKADVSLIHEIISLANECKNGNHSYICFYGD